jgi:pyridoxal phosphate enzyme (YggS family)
VVEIAEDANDTKARIERNLQSVRTRIADAARRSGRDPSDVQLVAVTKTVGVAEILSAADLGIDIVGENRVREALTKRDRVGDRVKWHMVGHLQRRKVRDAVSVFDCIHSVDSLALAMEIDKRCTHLGKIMPVLFEANLSGEETKFGLSPDETPTVIRQASALEHIRVDGLMTMAPLVSDAEEVRPCFRRLAQLAESVASEAIPNVSMKQLSMGMTNDFEVAIEEGATAVRIGTAIFGEG